MEEDVCERGVAGSKDQLERLLPVVRVIWAAGACSHDKQQDVLALYHDRLVLFRKRGLRPLPAEAYEPEGSQGLKNIKAVGPQAHLSFDQIAEIQVSKPGFFGRRWVGGRDYGYRIRVIDKAGAVAEMSLPEDDAEYVLLGFRGLPALAALLREDATLPKLPRKTKWLIAKPFSQTLRMLGALALIGLLGIVGGILVDEDAETLKTILGFCGSILLFVAFALFLLVLARAASNPRSAWKKKRRAERKRLKKGTANLSHQRPLRSPAASLVLKILGAITLLGAGLGHLWVAGLVPEAANVVAAFSSILYVPATCLIYYGYRLGLRSAEDTRREDHRAPVLYLRSFDQDARSNLNPTGFVAQVLGLESAWILRWLGPIGNINPVRLLRLLFSASADNSEEQLAAFFKRLGPVVAIGRPGERLALGGASRFYVGDEVWQDTVLRLIQEAGIVVLQPGDSEHVWWEVRETFKNAAGTKVLFSLLNCEKEQWRYDKFRTRFESEIETPLPRCLGENAFLYFSKAGATLLPLRRRWHLTWPVSGCAIHLRKTLAPFLANRDGGEAPISGEPGRFVRGLSALTAMAVWALLTSVGYFVLEMGFLWGRQHYAVAHLASRLQVPSEQMPIEGPGKIKYHFTLTHDWKPVTTSREIYQAGVRTWSFNDIAACSVTALEPEQAKYVPDWQTLSDKRRLAEVEVEALRKSISPSLQVIEEKTVRQAERDWVMLRMRATVPARFATAEEISSSGKYFLFGGPIIVTLRAYAGPDGMIEFTTIADAGKAASLDPALGAIWATFSVPSPLETMSRENEAERKQRLQEGREELPRLLAALSADAQVEPRTVAIAGHLLDLKRSWKSISGSRFSLGEIAELRIEPIVPLDSPTGLDGAQQAALDQFAADAPVVGMTSQRVEHHGMPWVEASFDTVLEGKRQHALQRVTVLPEGRVVLRATTAPEFSETLGPILRDALSGFRRATKSEVEFAAAPVLGGEQTIHRGRAINYRIGLSQNWQPISATGDFDVAFSLGDHAAVGVIAEQRGSFPRDIGTGEVVDFLLDTLKKSLGEKFELLARDSVEHLGKKWTRTRYVASFQGQKFQYTAHCVVSAEGVFQVIGWTDFETPAAHDRVVDPAFRGFAFPSDQR